MRYRSSIPATACGRTRASCPPSHRGWYAWLCHRIRPSQLLRLHAHTRPICLCAFHLRIRSPDSASSQYHGSTVYIPNESSILFPPPAPSHGGWRRCRRPSPQWWPLDFVAALHRKWRPFRCRSALLPRGSLPALYIVAASFLRRGSCDFYASHLRLHDKPHRTRRALPIRHHPILQLRRAPPSHARPVADHPFPTTPHHTRHAEPSLVVSHRTQPSLPAPIRSRALRSRVRALPPTLTHAARTTTLHRHRPHSAATDAFSIDLEQQPLQRFWYGGPRLNAHPACTHDRPRPRRLCQPALQPKPHVLARCSREMASNLSEFRKFRNNSLNL